MHDITFWRGVVQYARAAWKDCKALSLAPLTDAMPMLKKYNLVGKSTPRKRRPSAVEFDLLSQYLAKRDARSQIKLLPCLQFAVESTRRRGEICRLQWGDVDFAGHSYMIRDMKHPTKKLGNHKVFPLTDKLAAIIRSQPRLTDDPEERVFPYNAKSLGAAYTLAKKALGIENLRFHDNRREGISRLIEAGLPPHEARLISGHDNTIILEKVYDVRDPAKLHAKLDLLDKPKPLDIESALALIA
jgi:integrase